MKLSPDMVPASFRFCRRISRGSGSSFYLGMLLLPKAKRQAMDALYAFMRHTDDLVDNPQPAHLRRESLVAWRAALEHALLGQIDLRDGEELLFDRPEDAEARDGRALLPALAETVRRYEIPPQYLRTVIDGVEMDLNRRRYETFDELAEYCRCVASAVGLACLHIWGFRDQQALGPAEKCGLAMQLTNILRDLKEDADQDRIYLPMSDLRECGCSERDLLEGVVNGSFDRLMELEIGRAESFYRDGAELMHWLEPDGRRMFGLIMATYHALLKRIKRRPRDVFRRHVGLGRRKKVQLAARWMLLPPRAAALP